MQRSSVIAMGENRGVPRIYLQGKWLLAAGFEPDAKFTVEFNHNQITVKLSQDGKRKVSGKQNRTIPVIDIESEELRLALGSATKLQIKAYKHSLTIQPAYTLILISQRQLHMTEGGLFSGGGFLTEAAAQLGFKPQFGVEIEPSYAEVFEINHPGAAMFNMCASEVPWEALKVYRPLGLFTAGIPCEPYSNVRHWQKGISQDDPEAARRDRSLPPEAHDLGDMTFWTIRAIEATNAHTCILENVPGYLNSASYYVLKTALQRLGYNVDAQIINPVEYGELTTRKRAVIVARTGAKVEWPVPKPSTRTLGAIFDHPEIIETEWFNRETKAWLYNHWDTQTAKGNGFAAMQVSADTPTIGTIKKRYFAQQGDNPVVKHPTLPDTHRWLTLNEVKKLHGIREDYFMGSSKTLAGELVGQGVVVTTMRDIIAANMSTHLQ